MNSPKSCAQKLSIKILTTPLLAHNIKSSGLCDKRKKWQMFSVNCHFLIENYNSYPL